ncbi:RNA polymerase sigma factor [Actinoplanes sp. M2I2]|uniref:RNA polymerase sigma factor n=1 Tax=Actinoplanes sp. M2I2 TaxID=1734444 RepID=UPI00201FE0ED|nr:sigma-70 family RNA polymerase sigma factor [Actinoplanes sp. M2I2]
MTVDLDEADADLVRAGRRGDMAGVGLLLSRHRAQMYAVAISILGAGPDAEDAVQDASLIALSRLGELRTPQAVGPWLKGITRNTSRAVLRRARRPTGELPDLPAREPNPEELIDRLAVRDWVWRALDDLSPPLRLVTMLRYFTSIDDYGSIARACGVPVGTVRSRLSEARSRLAGALRDTADAAGADDLAALTETRSRQAADFFTAAERGDLTAMDDLFHADVRSWWPSGVHGHGTGIFGSVFDRDLAAGVRHPLRNVITGRDVLIWESDLVSPPWDPTHCPPGMAVVQTLRDGRAERVRVVHRPRPPAPREPVHSVRANFQDGHRH